MNATGTESIKLKANVVDRVREYKKKHGTPITVFIEKATEEKLDSLQKISKKIKQGKK